MKRKYRQLICCFLKVDCKNDMLITKGIFQLLTGIKVPVEKKVIENNVSEFNPPV